jgi:hypothetical protein
MMIMPQMPWRYEARLGVMCGRKTPAPKNATLIARKHHRPTRPLRVVDEYQVENTMAKTLTPNEKKSSDIIQP